MKSYARKGVWSTLVLGLYTRRENQLTRMEEAQGGLRAVEENLVPIFNRIPIPPSSRQ